MPGVVRLLTCAVLKAPGHDAIAVLSNSDNAELTFRPLFETILGDTVTPWEWEGYTPSYIDARRKP